MIEDPGLHAFGPERLPEEAGIPLLGDAVSRAKYDDVARPVAPSSRTGGKKDKEEHGTQAPDAHVFILTFSLSSFQFVPKNADRALAVTWISYVLCGPSRPSF
jgi:hypothetical protein